MREQLRELGRLEDIALNVTQSIITKGLHNLRDIEERHVNRVTLQCPHSVLDQIRMIPVCGQEVRYRRDRVNRGPEEKVLRCRG